MQSTAELQIKEYAQVRKVRVSLKEWIQLIKYYVEQDCVNT